MRRVDKTAALGALAALALTLAGSLCIPAAAQTHKTAPASVTSKDLTTGEWRLWGNFQELPMAGYPITFRANGEVTSSNIPSLRTWALAGGWLTLSDADGKPACRLKLDRRRRVFYTPADSDGGSAFPLRIGPAGLTASDVNRAGSPE